MNLIRHGRTLCRPKPLCGQCALKRMCPYGRGPGSQR
jgi:endonuclease III